MSDHEREAGAPRSPNESDVADTQTTPAAVTSQPAQQQTQAPAAPQKKSSIRYLGPPKRGQAKPATAPSTQPVENTGQFNIPSSTADKQTTFSFPRSEPAFEGRHDPANRVYSRSFLLSFSKTTSLPDSETIVAMKTSGVWTDSQESMSSTTATHTTAYTSPFLKDVRTSKPSGPKRGGFQNGSRPPRQSGISSSIKGRESSDASVSSRPPRLKSDADKFYGQIQSLLNKLTLDKFDTLSEKLVDLFKEIDDQSALERAVELVHKKALLEPHFAQMYTELCKKLDKHSPVFHQDNKQITFVRLLRACCQEAFQEKMPDVNATTDEEELLKKRQRSIGNIVFMGELFKGKLLRHTVVQQCIDNLIASIHEALPHIEGSPQLQFEAEANCERLVKLMATTGKELDNYNEATRQQMDRNLEILKVFANAKALTARVRFLIRDVIDLRQNNWTPRRKIEGPKTIDEIHADAELDQ